MTVKTPGFRHWLSGFLVIVNDVRFITVWWIHGVHSVLIVQLVRLQKECHALSFNSVYIIACGTWSDPFDCCVNRYKRIENNQIHDKKSSMPTDYTHRKMKYLTGAMLWPCYMYLWKADQMECSVWVACIILSSRHNTPTSLRTSFSSWISTFPHLVWLARRNISKLLWGCSLRTSYIACLIHLLLVTMAFVGTSGLQLSIMTYGVHPGTLYG